MRLFLFFILCFFSISIQATHIIGGYLNYTKVSNQLYDVTLTVYKDCQPFVDTSGDTITPIGFDNILGLPPVSPFLPDAYLNIYTGDPGFGTFTSVPFTSLDISQVQLNDPDSCLLLPDDICVQKGIYKVQLTIDSVAIHDIHLSYQRCCRNPSSVNVFVDPFGTGIAVAAKIPKQTSFLTNSNPHIVHDPPLAFCLNTELEFDLSAHDSDGDSLVYSLTTPLVGTGAGSSIPPVEPPYNLLTYNSGYTSSQPIPGNPNLSLNPSTGILSGNPDQLGPFIIGVKIQEFRNGILISQTIRDLRVFIVDCGENIAAFDLEDQICTQLGEIGFESHSADVRAYDWNFGDPSTLTDTSSLEFPYYLYTQNGIYDVTLIANFGTLCESKITKSFEYRNSITANIDNENAQCFENNSFDFNITSFDFPIGTSLNWEFGSNAIPQVDTGFTVDGVHFTTAGIHNVTLRSSFKECEAETNIEIEVYPEIKIDIPDQIILCRQEEMVIEALSNTNNLTYEWYLNEILVSNEPKLIVNIDSSVVFDLSLQVRDIYGCEKEIAKPLWLEIVDPAIAGFEVSDTSIFLGELLYIDNLSSNFSSILYEFGNGDTSNVENPSYAYSDIGDYKIVQTVNNPGDCPDIKIINVNVRYDHVIIFPNVFTPNGDDLNDTFFPLKKGIKSLSLEIYDRWGQKVYNGSQQQADHIWDGRYPDESLGDEEVYNYFCTYITELDVIFKTSGFVLLIK